MFSCHQIELLPRCCSVVAVSMGIKDTCYRYLNEGGESGWSLCPITRFCFFFFFFLVQNIFELLREKDRFCISKVSLGVLFQKYTQRSKVVGIETSVIKAVLYVVQASRNTICLFNLLMMDDLTFNIPLKRLCREQLSSVGPERIKCVCQFCISNGMILKFVNGMREKDNFIPVHQTTLGAQLIMCFLQPVYLTQRCHGKIYCLYNGAIKSALAGENVSFQTSQPSVRRYKAPIKPMSYCADWLLCRGRYFHVTLVPQLDAVQSVESLMRGYRAPCLLPMQHTW